jgi:hypothetical protein
MTYSYRNTNVWLSGGISDTGFLFALPKECFIKRPFVEENGVVFIC